MKRFVASTKILEEEDSMREQPVDYASKYNAEDFLKKDSKEKCSRPIDLNLRQNEMASVALQVLSGIKTEDNGKKDTNASRKRNVDEVSFDGTIDNEIEDGFRSRPDKSTPAKPQTRLSKLTVSPTQVNNNAYIAPLLVSSLTHTRVLTVACGKDHVLALTESGVYGWGSNAYGQLGIGSNHYVVPARDSRSDENNIGNSSESGEPFCPKNRVDEQGKKSSRRRQDSKKTGPSCLFYPRPTLLTNDRRVGWAFTSVNVGQFHSLAVDDKGNIWL